MACIKIMNSKRTSKKAVSPDNSDKHSTTAGWSVRPQETQK